MREQLLFRPAYEKDDADRVSSHLNRLVPHLAPGKFVLVGGLVTRHHVTKAGRAYPVRKIGDTDIGVDNADAVNPSIVSEGGFLVAHHHSAGVLFHLVDPEAKIKLDVFQWGFTPLKTESIKIAGQWVEIQSAEDQLAKTVYDMMEVRMRSVDPKQFRDARLLRSIVKYQTANTFWQEHRRKKRFKHLPADLDEAIALANLFVVNQYFGN